MPKTLKSTKRGKKSSGAPVSALRAFLKAQKAHSTASLLVTNHGRFLRATVYCEGGGRPVSETFQFLRLKDSLHKMLRAFRHEAKSEDITISLDCFAQYTVKPFKNVECSNSEGLIWVDEYDEKGNRPVTFELFRSIVSHQNERSVLTETTIARECDAFRVKLQFTDEAYDEAPPTVHEFLVPKAQPIFTSVLELLKAKTYISFVRVDISCLKTYRLAKLEKEIPITDDDIPI